VVVGAGKSVVGATGSEWGAWGSRLGGMRKVGRVGVGETWPWQRARRLARVVVCAVAEQRPIMVLEGAVG